MVRSMGSFSRRAHASVCIYGRARECRSRFRYWSVCVCVCLEFFEDFYDGEGGGFGWL